VSSIPAKHASAVAVCALLLVAALPVEADPAVQAAQERVSQADQRLTETSAALDRAAAGYEAAAAHHERIVGELQDADERVDSVEEAVDGAERALAGRLIELYRRSYETTAVTDALAGSGDVAGALHAAALLEHAAVRGAASASLVRLQGALTVDGVRQQHIVAAGAQAAAESRRAAADTLAAEVAAAQQAVAGARQAVEDARADAVARAEAERALAALAGWSGGPPPVVDGMTCPIAGPNGFVNSWGAPRSGGRRHKGVDMFAAYATPLYAVADGEVAVRTNTLGGLTIWLTAANGDRYYYAHLSGVTVGTGQQVLTGAVIGANGDSGNARGLPPHLHFEWHPGGGEAVDPYPLAVALCRPGPAQ
jgi:peptidoglycan LD-endopeptidase LytH